MTEDLHGQPALLGVDNVTFLFFLAQHAATSGSYLVCFSDAALLPDGNGTYPEQRKAQSRRSGSEDAVTRCKLQHKKALVGNRAMSGRGSRLRRDQSFTPE